MSASLQQAIMKDNGEEEGTLAVIAVEMKSTGHFIAMQLVGGSGRTAWKISDVQVFDTLYSLDNGELWACLHFLNPVQSSESWFIPQDDITFDA